MSCRPIVVKLGGDALASPERIAAEAHRLARWAERDPVVAVASARRGVTDHLLGLATEVRRAASSGVSGVRAGLTRPGTSHAEADRAVATGEIVTASLLALALNQIGVEAVSLDAREAGILGTGRFGGARIQAIASRRLERLLARGVIPVVTGFQGWKRGRVATLGRGGTDTSAVALAVALRATRAAFVKDADGLRTADPKLVTDGLPIGAAPHAFLSALTAAGARIVHVDAARLAEQHGLPLSFHSLQSDEPATSIFREAPSAHLRAVATLVLENGIAEVTAVSAEPGEAASATETLRDALIAAGIALRDIQPAANGPRFIVAAGDGVAATRIVHTAFVLNCGTGAATALRAS
jgi:aspartate kinase